MNKTSIEKAIVVKESRRIPNYFGLDVHVESESKMKEQGVIKEVEFSIKQAVLLQIEEGQRGQTHIVEAASHLHRFLYGEIIMNLNKLMDLAHYGSREALIEHINKTINNINA